MIPLLLVLLWGTDMKFLVTENRINHGTFLCEINGKLTNTQAVRSCAQSVCF